LFTQKSDPFPYKIRDVFLTVFHRVWNAQGPTKASGTQQNQYNTPLFKEYKFFLKFSKKIKFFSTEPEKRAFLIEKGFDDAILP